MGGTAPHALGMPSQGHVGANAAAGLGGPGPAAALLTQRPPRSQAGVPGVGAHWLWGAKKSPACAGLMTKSRHAGSGLGGRRWNGIGRRCRRRRAHAWRARRGILRCGCGRRGCAVGEQHPGADGQNGNHKQEGEYTPAAIVRAGGAVPAGSRREVSGCLIHLRSPGVAWVWWGGERPAQRHVPGPRAGKGCGERNTLALHDIWRNASAAYSPRCASRRATSPAISAMRPSWRTAPLAIR